MVGYLAPHLPNVVFVSATGQSLPPTKGVSVLTVASLAAYAS